MTPVFCCGFECGLIGALAHVQANTGTASFSTSVIRSGSRSLRINPTASIIDVVLIVTTSTMEIIRVYVRFDTLPSTNNTSLITITNGGIREGAWFNVSDNKIYAGFGTASFGATGVSVTTGIWYRIDVRVDATANPHLIDVQVNGVACGQASSTNASSGGSWILGTNQTNTADIFFDDVICSKTSADYPIGSGNVYAFKPTSDGTHNISGSGDFDRGDTGIDILSSTNDSYLLIDDIPLPSGTVDQADCIRALAPLSTEYTENVFGPDGTSAPSAPRAVDVIVAKHAAATQTCNITIQLNDNGTTDDIYNNTGNNGTAYSYARKQYATPPTGGNWTLTAGAGNFNNLRVRFLTSDANPDVMFDAAMIEAEFAPVVAAIPNKIFNYNQSVKRAAYY